MNYIQPTLGKERLEVIDALRGFALFGILLANLESFMGYNNYSPVSYLQIPLLDRGVLFLIDWFVEGKFYGIFSILFGVGFGLQASRFGSSSTSFRRYWNRRMLVLCGFGLIHMYFIWNGDILTLYALLGFLMPLFVKLSNRALLRWIIGLLIVPIIIFAVLFYTSESSFWGSLGRVSINLQSDLGYADLSLFEMRTSDVPAEVFWINILKAIPRSMSYLLSGRYFHVLGLFLIGLLLTRTWIPKISKRDIRIPSIGVWIGIVGFILSFFYAFIKGSLGTGFQVSPIGFVLCVVYNVGSTSFALGISMVFVRIWASGRWLGFFRNMAILGRMALSNYIFQNVLGVILFFGYGFALMGEIRFAFIPLIALCILTIQWVFSKAWLDRNKQGPLEYIWKKLSYRPKTNT